MAELRPLLFGFTLYLYFEIRSKLEAFYITTKKLTPIKI